MFAIKLFKQFSLKCIEKVWLLSRIPKNNWSLRVSGNLPKWESNILAIQLLKTTAFTQMYLKKYGC